MLVHLALYLFPLRKFTLYYNDMNGLVSDDDHTRFAAFWG